MILLSKFVEGMLFVLTVDTIILLFISYTVTPDCCCYTALLQTALTTLMMSQRQNQASMSTASNSMAPPPTKKTRFSLFGYYSNPPSQTADHRHEQQLTNYLDRINSVSFSPIDNTLASL